jgi:sirohydrochlorin cobaltochelatase
LIEKTDLIVVFAHGSRDPLWKLPIEAVAQRIAEMAPSTQVRCAYLELTTPSLDSVVDEFTTEFIATKPMNTLGIRIFPLFFGVGKHAREDLPLLVQALRAKYPNTRFDLLKSAGEHADVIEAAATAALS